VVGSLFIAMQKGVARGIFSNEAGLGSAPIATASAQTKDACRQGLVTMTGTFIDTIVICTLTGLSVIIAGSWNKGLEGVDITIDAFSTALPFPTVVSTAILTVCLVFFAFTTILGWDFYGEKCLDYLSHGNKVVRLVYRFLYIAAVAVGPYLTVAAVWNIADIFNGLMAVPNIIALFALGGVVAKATRAYVVPKEKKKAKK
ncbi:MAG: alanine:cation symporter family protein, partial [Clostridia bacterium]|nr:alanine:cation symporter family protein [Clostridia bacterium]